MSNHPGFKGPHIEIYLACGMDAQGNQTFTGKATKVVPAEDGSGMAAMVDLSIGQTMQILTQIISLYMGELDPSKAAPGPQIMVPTSMPRNLRAN